MSLFRKLIFASALTLGACESNEDKYGSQADAAARAAHYEVPGVPHLTSNSVPNDRQYVAVICGKVFDSYRTTTFYWMQNKEKKIMSFYHILPTEPMARQLGLQEGQTLIYKNGSEVCRSSSTFCDDLIGETGYHGGDTNVPPNGCQDGMGAGKKAPDFEYRSLNTGETVSLKGLEGKVIILDFWATWCGPCKKVEPFLEKLQDKYPQVKVIGISVDRQPEDLHRYLSEKKINYTIVNDFRWTESPVVKAYQVVGIPDVFLIDQKGVIAARNIQFDHEKVAFTSEKLDAKIRALLNK